MTALEEIKKALEGVAVREWTFDGPDDNIIIWCGTDTRVCFMTSDGPSHEHAQFITACSPTAISELLSTLESLQRENEHLSADVKREAELATHMANDCNDAQARAEAAEAEVKRLRDLLRFSHDTLWEINPSNYDHDDVCKLNDASVEVILAIAPELGETHGKSKEWWDERQALASTGGEHHAE